MTTNHTQDRLGDNERRLGVIIPVVMTELLSIEEITWYFTSDIVLPFTDRCPFWANAAVDGFREFDDWQLASNSDWFQTAADTPGLERLVVFADHSEAQLCLDYRENGPEGVPKVVFFDTSFVPISETVVAESAEDFAAAIIESAEKMEDD